MLAYKKTPAGSVTVTDGLSILLFPVAGDGLTILNATVFPVVALNASVTSSPLASSANPNER